MRPKALLIAAPGVFRDQLAQQLAGSGEVAAAADLAEARGLAADSLFAFAVIDEALEQEDGVAVAQALESDGFSAPILLLTAAERADINDGFFLTAKQIRTDKIFKSG